jgi:hypothetical protein
MPSGAVMNHMTPAAHKALVNIAHVHKEINASLRIWTLPERGGSQSSSKSKNRPLPFSN